MSPPARLTCQARTAMRNETTVVLLLSAKLPIALLLFLLLLRRAEIPTATLLNPAVLSRSNTFDNRVALQRVKYECLEI
jgi:hypothetical protein